MHVLPAMAITTVGWANPLGTRTSVTWVPKKHLEPRYQAQVVCMCVHVVCAYSQVHTCLADIRNSPKYFIKRHCLSLESHYIFRMHVLDTLSKRRICITSYPLGWLL